MTETDTTIAAVYFHTLPWRRPVRRRVGLLRRTRILRRSPRRVFSAVAARGVCLLSGSRLVHVSVGYDGAVLDPSFWGTRAWPMIPYTLGSTTAVGAFVVPVSCRVDLETHEEPTPRRRPVVRTLARWISRGRVRSRDCVSTVAQCLRSGGVDVPAYIVTPAELFRWLSQQGHPYEPFDRRSPAETAASARAVLAGLGSA